MTRLETFVRFTDGTGRVERVERDDAVGRRETDKLAFALLARPDVANVRVVRTARVAGGRRSYR